MLPGHLHGGVRLRHVAVDGPLGWDDLHGDPHQVLHHVARRVEHALLKHHLRPHHLGTRGQNVTEVGQFRRPQVGLMSCPQFVIVMVADAERPQLLHGTIKILC